jgi:hypothetical protein
MEVIPFDPQKDLILIRAKLYGPLKERDVLLALDTGASGTLISPEFLDDVGYSARDAIGFSGVSSVVGQELGYRLKIKRFEALGFAFDDFLIRAHDFEESSGIDGLLGLNFLKNFNYEIRSKEGLIRVSPA